MSEKFRRLCDDLLIQALDDMKIPYRIVGGPVPDHLEKIIKIFDLPVVVPIEEAIAEAERRVKADIEDLKADARFHEAQRQKSFAHSPHGRRT